jgi:hypothetical protein
MPQPLSRVVPTAAAGIIYFGLGKERERPELAGLAFAAICAFSDTDARLAVTASTLTAGRAEPVIDYYLSLRGDGQKSAALQTLAAAFLKPDRLNVFKLILKLFQRTELQRQPMAHWIWGIATGLPDALLAIDPKNNLARLGRMDTLSAMSTSDMSIQAMIKEIHDDMYDKIMVYRQKDFETFIAACATLNTMITRLNLVILYDRNAPERGEQKYQKLIQMPELRSLIEAQRPEGKAPPEGTP